MFEVSWGNSLWQLITQSDAMSRFVLLVLLVMSILCWSAFLYKLILLRVKRRQLKVVLKRLKTVDDLDELVGCAKSYSKTLPGYLMTRILSVLRRVSKADTADSLRLSASQWELFENGVYQLTDSIAEREESLISIMMASAQIAPLLGLFGTVWGLIHSFVRISEKHSADITTVAPGIAEALITTLVGLAVAIPALAMFHYLNRQSQAVTAKLNDVTDSCLGLVRSSCATS